MISPFTKFRSLAHLLLCCILSTFPLSAPAAQPQLQVPEGFTIQRADTPASTRFPMFACFDNRGRMFVAESSGLDLYAELQKLTRKCRISLLEDSDGDGLYENSQVFADQLVFPMGLAWRDGKLYVADPPELVALEDTDGDARADKRTLILREFGHTDNGSLHGLTFGPDGWLYMTMGQPDGYRIQRADGQVLEGKSGALIRCRPDGTDAEVVCRGFENLIEVVFMPAGEIVGTDTWFMLPAEGMRDALVHLLEGGLYPRILEDAGTKYFRPAEPLPAIKIYPAVSHSGFMRYRGNQFPGMKNHLFSAQFNTRKVIRHELAAHGATFQSADTEFITTEDPDFHPSDVLEGADGTLYIIDTGSWYVHHCPTGRIRQVPAEGGIYRVSHSGATATVDPWGRKIDWKQLNEPQLFQRAKDPSWALRDQAIEELLRRKAENPTAWSDLVNSKFQEEALWALARLHSPASLAQIRQLLSKGPAETQALAARILGRIADHPAQNDLEKLMGSSDQRIRLAAAEALAQCGTADSISVLVQALTKDSDAMLEHAITFAIYRLCKPEAQLALLHHPHPRVKKAALVLLDQASGSFLKGELVASLAFDPNENLAKTARRILGQRPEWVNETAKLLAHLLQKQAWTVSEQEALGNFLPLFGTRPQVASQITKALDPANSDVSSSTRIALLQGIAHVSPANAPPDWIKQIALCIKDGTPDLATAAIQTAGTLRLGGLENELAGRALDQSLPATVRVEALRALVRTRKKLNAEAIKFLTGKGDRSTPPAVRLAAIEVLAAVELRPGEVTTLLQTFGSDPVISPNVLLGVVRRNGVHPESEQAIVQFLESHNLSDDDLTWLEQNLSVENRGIVREIKRRQESERAAKIARLKELEPLATGGDYNRGQQLFVEKVACIACHRVGTVGGLSGPDLTKIGAIRSGRDLLESLLIPSATFAQGYESYHVKLKDGTELTGVRAREAGDALVIRDASGTPTRVESDNLESIERSEVSLMPEGLLDSLTESEIRDLLAYLQSLK